MDKLLNCPYCLRIYNSPRQLECDHVLCTRCIENVYNPHVTPIIKCPVCDKHSMVITSIDKSFPVINCVEQLVQFRYKYCHYEDNLSIPLNNNSNKNANNKSTFLNSTSPTLISSSPPQQTQRNKITLSPQRASANYGATTTTTTTSTSTANGSKSVSKPPLKLKAISSPPITPNISTPERCNNLINDKNKHVLISSETTIPINQPLVTPRINDSIVLELSRCQSHDQNKYNLFCVDCEIPICSDCVIDHSGHIFNKIIQEAEKRIGDIESMIITMSLCPNRLISKKNKIEKIITDSALVLKETKSKITSDIDTMIENLKERKFALINQIDKEYQEQKLELNDQIDTIMSTITDIQSNTATTQGIVSLYLSQVDSELISCSLLRKYSDLKKMDVISDKLSNNLEQNIEWKWDPEFHFPQLFTRSNGEKTTVVYRTKRVSVNLSSSPTSSTHSNTSPPSSISNNNQITPPLPSISSPTGPNANSGIIKKSVSNNSNTSNGNSGNIGSINSSINNSTSSTINRSQSSNLSLSMPTIPQIILPSSPSASNIPSKLTSSKPPQGDNSVQPSATSTKIQLKNPVFGKLLTRKDSVMTSRRQFVYGFSDNQVEIYDNFTKCWRPGSKIPKKSIEHSSIFDGNNLIYRFGGKEIPTEIHAYNVDRDQWNQLKVKIPSKRNAHCSVFDGINFIYLIGGADKDSNKLLERFDIEKQTWTRLSSMKHQRSYFNAFYHSSKKCIYVLDGYCNKDGKSSVEMYNIEKNQWSVICEINQPRYLGGVSFDGSKYINIIGGVDRSNSKDIKTMERFDTTTHRWEQLNNEAKSLLSHTSSSMNLMCVNSPQLKKNNSFSSISSHSSLASSSSFNQMNGANINTSNSSIENEIPTEKMQFFNSSFFDGEQYIYFFGINVDEPGPLLYKFSIKTKKFEKIPIDSTNSLDLFSTLIFISK